MKKKTELEADLDAAGTRHTRPGGKAAQVAIADSKGAAKRKRRPSEPTRPGATAAARAVEASKKKRGKSR
jgi:hypothetical protein